MSGREIMSQEEAKRIFAELLLRDPFRPDICATKTAYAADLTDVSLIASIARTWPFDIAVKAEQARLLEEFGQEHFIPNKYDLAREAWQIGTAPGMTEDKLKGLKLYADIMGFISKGPAVVVNNDNRVIKVMEVPTHGTDEEWEQRTISNQKRLDSFAT